MSASSDACAHARLASTSARVRSLPERFVSGCFFSRRFLLKLSEVRQFVQLPSLHSRPPEREIKSRMMAYQPRLILFKSHCCCEEGVAVPSSEPTRCYGDPPHANNNLGLSSKKLSPGFFYFFFLSGFLKLWKLLTRTKIHIYFIKWMWIYLKPIHK